MNRPIHNRKSFNLPAAGSDPFYLFDRWFADAAEADARNASVAAFATASSRACPSLRMVLLKQHDPDGFVFYTNYESRKAAEITENPNAAMTFWWPAQERQVRIEGKIEKIDPLESDAYFVTRPRESQLSAWASAQSQIIEQPVSLDALRERFGNGEIPRPAHWGGFRLIPALFEFWQGRENRLHDRIRFTKHDRDWKTDRLAP
ncbi:MAG: pyridoxamine 5-phosphate oxidase [Verrucomicrobiota bacterium]|jgi:pyridoxamine 5'-phosphate oxidase|nr:pyridoxamine 5-phosphate oxidase [Verrucomicrobiota bacterium]